MNFNIRKDANGIEVFSPLPHKIIMLMPIFQFFHKNKPSIKSTYLGFVLFSGRQIQRFAVGEILWSIYTEIIPGEEPSRVVTVLGRGLRGTLWRLLQFYCHVIFSSAGGIDLETFLCKQDCVAWNHSGDQDSNLEFSHKTESAKYQRYMAYVELISFGTCVIYFTAPL